MNFAGRLLITSLVLGASLHAATTYTLDFNTTGSSPGLVFDGSVAIGPYSGTVAGSTLQLFCDDYTDDIGYGQQNITVYQTSLTANSTTLADQTRYGAVNPNAAASYPAGTQLYDELTWLGTQMLAVSGTNATYNDIAIQEAIWTLTDNTSAGIGPHNQTTTGAGPFGDSGAQQSYLAWIADAAADAGSNVAGYASLVTANWTIVTAQASAGCTAGSGTVNSYMNVSACTPGTAGTGNATQELLAYSGGTPSVYSPEPASFFLIGSGLVAIFARRKSKAQIEVRLKSMTSGYH